MKLNSARINNVSVVKRAKLVKLHSASQSLIIFLVY